MLTRAPAGDHDLSVGVRPFLGVLEDPAGAGVDADFKGHALALDVERIAQAGASAFLFELLIGDVACAIRSTSRARA